MKRSVLFLIAISFFVPSFAGAATKVKIGFVNSITGPEAPIGENLTNGVTHFRHAQYRDKKAYRQE